MGATLLSPASSAGIIVTLLQTLLLSPLLLLPCSTGGGRTLCTARGPGTRSHCPLSSRSLAPCGSGRTRGLPSRRCRPTRAASAAAPEAGCCSRRSRPRGGPRRQGGTTGPGLLLLLPTVTVVDGAHLASGLRAEAEEEETTPTKLRDSTGANSAGARPARLRQRPRRRRTRPGGSGQRGSRRSLVQTTCFPGPRAR